MWPSFGKHCFSWVRTRVYGQPALRRWPDNKEGSALREASTTVRGNTTAANSLFKLEYFGVRRPVGALVAGDLSPAASRQGMPQRGYGLQPRVAASATLGKESDLVLNRNAVASALCISL